MTRTTIHAAKTNLSKLISAVRKGEDVVICQAGKPVARLTAFEGERKVPQLGIWRDRIKFQPGWDSAETDAEVAKMFEDSINEPEPK